MEEGNTILTREVHPAKVPYPSEVMEEGIVTLSREMHPSKVPSPSEVMVASTAIFLI